MTDDIQKQIEEHEQALRDLYQQQLEMALEERRERQDRVRVSTETAPDTTYYGAPIRPKGLAIHAESVCNVRTDVPCIFHSPSVHHMTSWPIFVRLDRFGALAERTCRHGVGHPDPDSLAYVESLHEESQRGYEGTHGCDGCCAGPGTGPN